MRRLPVFAIAAATILVLAGCSADLRKAEEYTDEKASQDESTDETITRLDTEDEDEDLYVENNWNFVEESMDISGGIPENAVGRLEKIRQAGVLTVATEPYYAPQEFIDPSLKGQEQYVGADMELARLIAERMGVELEIVPLDFNDVIDSTAEGRYDLAISALAFTEGRAAILEMSKGYYFSEEEVSSGLLIRAEREEEIHGISDLELLDIAAQSGSLQETMAADVIPLYRQFLRLHSVDDVINAVKDQTVDAGIIDASLAVQYITSHPGCRLHFISIPDFILAEAYRGDRIAAQKGELQLIYFVNGVIDEVLASGQYDRWFEQYTLE